jgi:hypothetical protein
LTQGRSAEERRCSRILFALAVLLSHAPELTGGNPHRELLYRLTHRFNGDATRIRASATFVSPV